MSVMESQVLDLHFFDTEDPEERPAEGMVAICGGWTMKYGPAPEHTHHRLCHGCRVACGWTGEGAEPEPCDCGPVMTLTVMCQRGGCNQPAEQGGRRCEGHR